MLMEPEMSHIIDLVGLKFGRWYVKSYYHKKGKMFYWNCICDCGTERPVFGGDLKRGGSLSCGCLKDELSKERLTKHNKSRTAIYGSWKFMLQRCNNPKDDGYYLYGGRGIRVCEAWLKFENFDADMSHSWKAGLSLDRIDTNGDYSPENCKWSTPMEQANNRRNNVTIDTPKGRMTITEAAKCFDLKPVTIFARIRYGWPEKDLLKPTR